MATRILVVEDDRTIALAIIERLTAEGFETISAARGEEAIALATERLPDLVVLDLMLPGIDGLEVCRRLQALAAIPVIMLTARTDEADRLIGLGIGADDYITKPFSQKELVARIRALLRRIEITRTTMEAESPSEVVDADVVVRPASRTVIVAGSSAELTPIEFDLYLALLNRRGEVRRREDLLYEVWGHRDGSGLRTVDSHVRSLRRKLGDEAIRTVHGVGYASRAPQ